MSTADQFAFLLDPNGRTVAVPKADAAGYADMGYAPASPEQAAQFIAADEAAKKFGTTGQTIAAGAEAAGRGLTLGLSTVAERLAGVPAEDIAARESANPVLAPAVEIAAGIAPLIVSGGASAPEQGAGLLARAAAKTGPSLALRAGEGAAGITAKALPEATSALGRIGTAGVRSATDFATQGAISGAGRLVHEAALGDPELTAGKAIAEIGLSAVLSGGLGAALGIGARTVGEGITKAQGATTTLRDLIVERYPGFASKFGAASEEDTAALMRNRAKLAGGATPEEILTAENPLPTAPAEPVPLTTAPAPRDAEAFAGEVRDSLGQHMAQMDNQISKGFAKLKPAEFAPLLDQVPPEVAATEWARISNTMREAIETLRAEPDLYEPAAARRLEQIREGMSKAVQENPTPHNIYDRIEEAKRLMWDESQIPRDPSRQQQLTASVVKDAFGTARRSLEDVDVWGEAGARQAARNSALTEFKTIEENMQKYFTRIEKRRGGEVRVPDAKKINTFLNRVGTEANADAERYLSEYLTTSTRLLDEIDRTAQLAGDLNYDTEAARRLVDRTAKATQAAQDNVATASAFASQEEANAAAKAAHKLEMGSYRVNLKEAKADIKARAKALEGGHESFGLNVLGIAESVHNPLLAPVYAAYKVGKLAQSPARVIKTLAALEKLNESIGSRIDSQASTLVRAGARVSAVGQGEIAAGISKAYALDAKTAVKNYERQTNEVAGLAGAPARMFAQLNTAVSDGLGEHAPETAAAIATTSARGVAFLASKVPQPTRISPYAPPIPPTRQQIATWNHYREAVDKPLTILKQAAAGTLTPQAVEAVQVVYPQLLDMMRFAVAQQIQTHGTPPPSQWGSIELLMGVPMFRDPNTVLDSAATYIAIREQQKAMRQTRTRAPSAAAPKHTFNTMATGIDKLTAGSTSSPL